MDMTEDCIGRVILCGSRHCCKSSCISSGTVKKQSSEKDICAGISLVVVGGRRVVVVSKQQQWQI